MKHLLLATGAALAAIYLYDGPSLVVGVSFVAGVAWTKMAQMFDQAVDEGVQE